MGHKNNKKMKKTIFLSISLFFVVMPIFGYTYDGKTHSKIAEKAVEKSNLSEYLKNNLGISDGKKFNGKTAKEWIMLGAKLEDSKIRMFNHFHNPIDNSGLHDIGSGKSARLWGTTTSNNDWSWQKAREYYYKALTLPTKAERETAYADMFRSLGQVMHLVQDMAVPAHTRNDAHPPGDSDPYEEWCRGNINNITSSGAVDFSGLNDFQVGDFWDAEVYDGSSVPSASVYKGLAEFTNANFISDDTKFTNTLPQNHKWYQPHPTLEETDYNQFTFNDNIKQVQARDGTWHNTIYLTKDVEDQNVEHFVQVGYFPVVLNMFRRSDLRLDERCHQDYADILIPKAVSYSAGLLNYFFRDEIQLVGIDSINNSGVKFHLLWKEGNYSANIMVFYDDESFIRIGGGYYWWSKKYGEYSYLKIEPISNNEIWLTVPFPYTNPIRYVMVDNGSVLIGKVINKAILRSLHSPGQIITKYGYVDWDDENVNNKSWNAVRSAAYTNFLNDDLSSENHPGSIGATWLGGGNWYQGLWGTYDAEMRSMRRYANLGTFSYINNCLINKVTIYTFFTATKDPENIGASVLVYRASSNTWPPYWDCGDKFIFTLHGNPVSSYNVLDLNPDSILINSPNIWETKIPGVDQFANAIPKEAPTGESEPGNDPYLMNGIWGHGSFFLTIDYEEK